MRRHRRVIIVRHERAGLLEGADLLGKMVIGMFIFAGWLLIEIGKILIDKIQNYYWYKKRGKYGVRCIIWHEQINFDKQLKEITDQYGDKNVLDNKIIHNLALKKCLELRRKQNE